ncbi:MAG: ComEC/Rec2 family competence protein [Candidatus Dojkabacteria bacterium]
MLHAFREIFKKAVNRAKGLVLYLIDYKVISFSLLCIFSYTITLNLLRNIGVGTTIGLCTVAGALLVTLLMTFLIRLWRGANRKTGKRAKAGGGIFVLHLRSLVIALCATLISIFYASLTYGFEYKNLESVPSFTQGTTELEAYIIEEPDMRHDKQFLEVQTLGDTVLFGKYYGYILIKVDSFYKFKVGQVCKFKGALVEPESFLEFDYKKYLRNKKIYLVMDKPFFECINIAERREGFFLKNILVDFKNNLIKKVDGVLSEPQSSLLVGILFGQKRLFSSTFEKYIRVAGVSHVAAASGYNVAILVLAINKLLFFLPKKYKIIIGLVVIWCFALLSGLSASITRACIMSTISLLALFLGRGSSIHISIPLATIIFLIFNPYILSDIGFQLSLCATMGLVYLLPILLKAKEKITKRYKVIEEYVLPTMSCTLSTLPISISVFKTFSIWSVPANSLILPIIESTMLWGLLSILTRYINNSLSYLFFTVTNIQLKYFEYMVNTIGKINLGSWDLSDDQSVVISGLIIVVLIAIIIYFYPVENEKYNYYLKSTR